MWDDEGILNCLVDQKRLNKTQFKGKSQFDNNNNEKSKY